VRAVKLVTWNVNSIRARHDRVLAWVKKNEPDVLCMQEIKCVDKQFPTGDFEALGYDVVLHGQPTYNGVAIATRAPYVATDVTRGFGDDGDEAHARAIAATIAGVRVLDVYVPNGQAPGTEKYAFKLEWYARLRAYVAAALAKHERFVVLGDFNVAPHPEDVHDPAVWEGQIHFSIPEREALATVVATGLEDVLRKVHPTGQFFTWWDYRQLAFPKNKGLRIDHILASPALAARVKSVFVDREERKGKEPSDHAPVVAELDVGPA
jgi:exodeoxyribonuclease-3